MRKIHSSSLFDSPSFPQVLRSILNKVTHLSLTFSHTHTYKHPFTHTHTHTHTHTPTPQSTTHKERQSISDEYVYSFPALTWSSKLWGKKSQSGKCPNKQN